MGSSRRSAKDAEPVIEALVRALDAAAGAASPVPDGAVVAVAFSGGLDSTVLLHAAAAALGASRVRAIHVHHGLQPAADAWPAHCAQIAASLGVAFESHRIAPPPMPAASVEAWARDRRYESCCAAALRLGAAVLLTAHHADDQVETLLMRIARGTGPDGLTGIRALQQRGGVTLLRPLLGLPRDTLRAYAHRHGLDWVEDPSNLDPSHLRNAFRHQALPAIDAVAPHFRAKLLQFAVRLDEARAAVHALAQIDLARARIGSRPEGVAGAPPIDADLLGMLPAPRRAAALRNWIGELGLRAPTQARLRAIEAQLLLSAGPYACVAHDGMLLRRHRRALHATVAPARTQRQALAPDRASVSASDGDGSVVWRGEASLQLPGYDGRLHFDEAPDGVSAEWLLGRSLALRRPWAGARLRPHPKARRRTLKNLWQEHGVPAWERPGLPLLQHGEQLLFAAGIGMDRSSGWPSEGRCVRLRWQPGPV